MTIALLLPFLFTAAPRSAASPVRAEDRLIVPAVRVGAITAQTSEADLVKVYGASHVRKRDFCRTGSCTPATDLFPDDPQQHVTIMWTDPKARRGATTLLVYGAAWKTAEGVGVGTTLRELNRLNGKAFDFSGFGPLGAGAVLDWNGGGLEKYDPTTVGEKFRGRLIVFLDPGRAIVPESLLGDRDISSQLPETIELMPQVGIIQADLP